MTRVLAIDFGETRVGLAVCDELRISTRPINAIQRVSDDQVIEQICLVVEELEVGDIVLGLPLDRQAQIGPQARRVQSFGAKLEKTTGYVIHYADETFTSHEARSMMQEMGLDEQKNSGMVDSISAQLILKAYLDG